MAPRRTRRRPDPLSGGLWDEALTWLVPTPEIDGKVLFEHLLGRHPEWVATAGKALRTFQRRIKQWRELSGPPKDLYFPQIRKPGECVQFDWTRVKRSLWPNRRSVPKASLRSHIALSTPCSLHA